MKRYRFELETVLRVRRVQEEAAGFALAHANRDLQRAVLDHRVALARYESLQLGHGPLDLDSFRRDRDKAERLAGAVESAWTNVQVATDEVATRHAQWSTAAQRVAALEHLDERRRAEWLVDEQRAEMAAIDESAIAGWLADAADDPGPQRDDAEALT
jgi:flagellar export protein FliJ